MRQGSLAGRVGGFDMAAITGAMVACTVLYHSLSMGILQRWQWLVPQMNGEAPLYGIPSHYSREVKMSMT